MTPALEIVLFRLKSGSDPEAFLKAAQATFDLLPSFDGYLDRELSVTEDGLWTDVVHWTNMQAALSAAESFMAHPVAQDFGDFIDPDTISMHHARPRLSTALKQV